MLSPMVGVDYPDLQDSGTRHVRVACKQCGMLTEIARLRDHLRSVHGLDSTGVESAYLAALMEVRRNRRGRG